MSTDRPDRAVVLGGSVAGILAARALTGTFRQVTVVERDELPDAPVPRRGVPQARHGHGLLARGAAAIEAMSPGVLSELAAAGAPVVTDLAEMHFAPRGVALHDGPGRLTNRAYLTSRPLLEHTLRNRLRAVPNVEILDGCEATAPIPDTAGDIIGARIHRRSDNHAIDLPAQLVVDATGRPGRGAAWLAGLGFRPPTEDRIRVDVGYLSRMLHLPDGAIGRRKVVLVGASPTFPAGFALFAHENQQWMLTLYGYRGHHPPADEQGVLDLLRQLAPAQVHDAVKAAEPLTDPVAHKVPDSVRRRWEHLDRLPAGLIVFGDALCTFNPIYGQGMAIAALQAETLRRELAHGTTDLPRRWFSAAARTVDTAWRMACAADLAIPQIPGRRTPLIRASNRYAGWVHHAAARDPWLTDRFHAVVGLIEPPAALLTPRVLARVAVANLRHRQRHRPAIFPS